MSQDRTDADTVDYDGLMQANLNRVFGERDEKRRLLAIAELYAPDAVLHEPQASAVGHTAISNAVTVLLGSLPHDFSFTSAGPAVGHHGVARLRWQAGPPGGPVAATGTDVARFEGGKIRTLHVFRDPAP